MESRGAEVRTLSSSPYRIRSERQRSVDRHVAQSQPAFFGAAGDSTATERSASRACVSRARTVATGTASSVATSWYDIRSTATNTSTSRCSIGSRKSCVSTSSMRPAFGPGAREPGHVPHGRRIQSATPRVVAFLVSSLTPVWPDRVVRGRVSPRQYHLRGQGHRSAAARSGAASAMRRAGRWRRMALVQASLRRKGRQAFLLYRR